MDNVVIVNVSPETSVRKRGVYKKQCSKCDAPLEPTRIGKQCYCRKCHAANMRENRVKHSDLMPEAKKKANARAYLHVYIKRGKIKKQGCKVCGAPAEAHHHDYSKPLEVEWFCREHHLELHKSLNVSVEDDSTLFLNQTPRPMRKQLAMAMLLFACSIVGMQVASFKPSPKPIAVNYDPEKIKGSILIHQLVESADFGVLRC